MKSKQQLEERIRVLEAYNEYSEARMHEYKEALLRADRHAEDLEERIQELEERNEEMETDLYADEDVEENVEDEIRAVLAEEESDLIALSKKYVERQIEAALEDHEEHYRRQEREYRSPEQRQTLFDEVENCTLKERRERLAERADAKAMTLISNDEDWFDEMSKESEDDDEMFDSAWEEGSY
jgi:hypothetical protein